MNINMPTSLAGERYQLGQLVGRGGMAEVHVALDTRLGRTVAVKIMRADFATGVPPNIYAFHRYTRNSANLYFTQDLQFQAPLPVEPIYFTPDLPARLRSLYTQ